MPKFKITYIKESQRVMIVEGKDLDDAKKNYENYDNILDDYEDNGIDERIQDIKKID